MTAPSSCPGPNRLKGLLDDSLPENEQAALTGHLDGCACCQQTLERLATDDSSLARTLHAIDQAQPGPKSAYWPALHALEREATEASPPAALSVCARHVPALFGGPSLQPLRGPPRDNRPPH